MKLNTIKLTGDSAYVNMGPIKLRQPIPTPAISGIDPFILLHHYGPYKIEIGNNPFDLGPHPHRGFEPVTFLIEGEQLHRDSLGNESIVKAGDVQWTTAGRGIIHAEAPTKAFVEKGGILEGIQLWLNLPAEKKMIPANYQHVAKAEFKQVVSKDKKVTINVIAGALNGINGRIRTQTPVNAYMVDVLAQGTTTIAIPVEQQAFVYLLKGHVIINNTTQLKLGEKQLAQFNQDGQGFSVTGTTDSKLLVLSGVPFNEPVKTYGPYVMNTQTELMEAMRDYQMGKMGFLTP